MGSTPEMLEIFFFRTVKNYAMRCVNVCSHCDVTYSFATVFEAFEMPGKAIMASIKCKKMLGSCGSSRILLRGAYSWLPQIP